MPTTKPRLTVVLDQETYDIIEDLAAARHVSKGTIIRDFMAAASPVMERTAALIRYAETVTGTAADDYASKLDQAQSTMEGLLGDIMEALAETDPVQTGDGSGDGEAGSGAAPGGAGSDPRTLTGGSEFQKRQQNQQKPPSGGNVRSTRRKAS